MRHLAAQRQAAAELDAPERISCCLHEAVQFGRPNRATSQGPVLECPLHNAGVRDIVGFEPDDGKFETLVVSDGPLTAANVKVARNLECKAVSSRIPNMSGVRIEAPLLVWVW